jgi:adenylate cyclase
VKEIVYTVYTCSGGRWVRGSIFTADQKAEAVETAKGQFGGGKLDGISVVKETFNPDDGSTDELAIFSDKKNDSVAGLGVPELQKIEVPKEKEKPKEKPPSSGSDDGPKSAPGKKGKAAPKNDIPDIPEAPSSAAATFVVFKIIGALIIAGGVAGGISFVMGQFGGYGIFGSVLGNQGLPLKVFAIIFLVVLMIALPNMVGWGEMMKAFSTAPPKSAPRRPQPQRRRPPTQDKPETYSKPKPTAKSGGNDEAATDQPGQSVGQAGPEADHEPEPQPEPEPEPEPEEPLSEEVVEAQKSVMSFMGLSMEFITDNNAELVKGGKLSAFNQFGTDLFLAGAAEAYSETHGIKDDMPKVIKTCVEGMGRTADRAGQFSDKYDSYLLEPRYLDMFRSGREAMASSMRDEVMRAKAAAGELEPEDEKFWEDDVETDIGIFLVNALDDWNVKETSTNSGTVTVLFTDIVASTAFTQEHGDAVSQKLVNAHNRVVREALRKFDGREIKHTGDGIMAAFGQATQGVEAATDMMRGLTKHNAANPELPLHLNIGINAGEPIQEDDDLFGTPVQLAARVCGFAGTDQIAVSKLVKDLCAGKGLKFNDLGEIEFKGFAEKIPVSEVLWREATEEKK